MDIDNADALFGEPSKVADRRKPYHDLVDSVMDTCDVDEVSGQFKCRKCGCLIYIDWFELEVEGCMCDEE